MAKPLRSPHSSTSSTDTEGSSQGVHPEHSQSLEAQGFELGIVPSIQPLASRPPPLDSSLSQESDPETTESPQRFVLYPLNPLFDPFVISPQHPYSPNDQPSVPLELSPHPYRIPPRQLFPPMASEGEIPASPQGPPEVSSTHTPSVDNDSKYDFPPKDFPYVGRVPSQPPPENSGPMLPHGYTTLAQLVLGNPSDSSLYKNPIWSSNSMATFGRFILNMTSHIHVQTIVTSVLIQLTIMSQPLPSFQPSIPVKLIVSFYMSLSSSILPSSGQNVSPPHS